MDELEYQVALASVRIRLRPGLQVVPAVLCTVKILKPRGQKQLRHHICHRTMYICYRRRDEYRGGISFVLFSPFY